MDQSSLKVLTSQRVLLLLMRAAAVRTIWIPVVWIAFFGWADRSPWPSLLAAGAVIFVTAIGAATVGAVLATRGAMRSDRNLAVRYASASDEGKVELVLAQAIW
jgi:hypothetical protein